MSTSKNSLSQAYLPATFQPLKTSAPEGLRMELSVARLTQHLHMDIETLQDFTESRQTWSRDVQFVATKCVDPERLTR